MIKIKILEETISLYSIQAIEKDGDIKIRVYSTVRTYKLKFKNKSERNRAYDWLIKARFDGINITINYNDTKKLSYD